MGGRHGGRSHGHLQRHTTCDPAPKEVRSWKHHHDVPLGGRFGYPNRSPYNVAKAGLIGFAKALAIELGDHNIRANAIAPGAVGGQRIENVLAGGAKAEGKSVDEERASMLGINR